MNRVLNDRPWVRERWRREFATQRRSANRLVDMAARAGASNDDEESTIERIRAFVHALRYILANPAGEGRFGRIALSVARAECMAACLVKAADLFERRGDSAALREAQAAQRSYREAAERLHAAHRSLWHRASDWHYLAIVHTRTALERMEREEGT